MFTVNVFVLAFYCCIYFGFFICVFELFLKVQHVSPNRAAHLSLSAMVENDLLKIQKLSQLTMSRYSG